MTRSVTAFISRVVRSHLAHVLLAISWTFILLVYVRSFPQPHFVGCTPKADEIYSDAIVDIVHPVWTSVIVVAHLPAIAVTVGITTLLQRVFSLSCGPSATVEVPLLFLFSAIQWLLVGYTIETLFRRVRSHT
jgi:hypothetical protein